MTQRDPKKQKLFIVDCRSALNAYANSAKGAGTELIQNYPECSLEYCGIENIHAMRNSLYEIFNYISPANSSAWSSQLLSIIQSSKRVAEIIDSGFPVLIHCSDGWDRTSQISSLSQLLIDPFYRTIEGFQQLIEKDWVIILFYFILFLFYFIFILFLFYFLFCLFFIILIIYFLFNLIIFRG